MTHGSGTRTVIAAAVLAALAPVAMAPAPVRAADDTLVSVTDGCGRVDSLKVDTPGDYWLQVLPDGKAPKTTTGGF